MCKISTICLLTKEFEYFCDMNNILQEDTICALATGGSLSAIAIIRLSGNNAVKITNTVFSKDISNVKTIVENSSPVNYGHPTTIEMLPGELITVYLNKDNPEGNPYIASTRWTL